MSGILWSGETPFVGDSALAVVVARNADGRLEIFYIGTNNQLYHNWQTTPGGPTWSGETSFPGDSAKDIAVGQNMDGRLEIFYIGINGTIYHNWQTTPGGSTWFGETAFTGDRAQHIAVGQNYDGRVEIFYIGTQGHLLRNVQTTPGSTSWAGETAFAGDSAKQVTVGRNMDGTLEIFYVGTNNNLYHNRQTSANSTQWAGEVAFAGDSAKQITVALNSNNELEIFYIGTNNDLYHNWQTAPNSTVWQGETTFLGTGQTPGPETGQQIAVSANGQSGLLEIFFIGTDNAIYHKWQTIVGGTLGSNFNYIFSSNCQPLMNLSVTINVTEDMVSEFSSGSINGFSFQLNAYSPAGYTCAWQQYVVSLYGSEINAGVDNWPIKGVNLVRGNFPIVALPAARIPVGFQLTISLQNDSTGNVISATYVVVDNGGKTLANVTKVLASIGAMTQDLAPITAFELNLVGPVNYEGSILSSGAGTLTYMAANALTPSLSLPACTETLAVTAETANSVYSGLPTTPSTTITQNFNIAIVESALIRRQGKIRPSTTFPT